MGDCARPDSRGTQAASWRLTSTAKLGQSCAGRRFGTTSSIPGSATNLWSKSRQHCDRSKTVPWVSDLARHRGPPVPIRRALVERFPYAIAFEAHPDAVFILAVAHAKRRPLYWLHRSGTGAA
jgi:hypothetical protein